MSVLSREELQTKLRSRLATIQGQRTGSTIRNARKLMPKQEKNQLLKEIRKKGVKALTEKLGIKDRETQEMVAKMIATGDLKNVDDLVQRITQYQAQSKMQAEAEAMAAQGPPAELYDNDVEQTCLPHLPSAHAKRKTLKPPTSHLATTVPLE